MVNALDRRPILYDGYELYVNTYFDLAGGKLPVSDIISYGKVLGIEDLESFVRNVKSVERALLSDKHGGNDSST